LLSANDAEVEEENGATVQDGKLKILTCTEDGYVSF